MIGADPTGAFSGVQAVVIGVVLLAVSGTLGLYLLGLPVEMSGAVFIVLFVVLMALGWSRFETVHPRYDRTDRK